LSIYNFRLKCKRGHFYTVENTYKLKDGMRRCKKCARENDKKHRSTEKFRLKHNQYMRQYYPGWVRQLQEDTLTHYGNGIMACVCCGEKRFLFLTIDHINGRTKEEMKNYKYRGWQLKSFLRTNNYPKGYQTLCWNCNSGRQLNKGLCPHKIV
jgi:hypothetical protein